MTGTTNTLQGESNLTFDGSTLAVTNTSVNPSITITDTSTNDPYIRMVPGVSTNAFAIGIDDSDSDKFKISYGSSAVLGTNDRVVIDTSGNVGIGTSVPIRKLDVSGSYEFTHNPVTELSSSGGYGDAVTFGTGGGTTFSCYYYTSGGAWTLSDSNAAASSTGMLAIALGNTVASGMLLRGYVRNTSWSFATASALYLNSTAGALSTTAPTSANDVIRIVGFAVNSTTIHFCPDNTWIEI